MMIVQDKHKKGMLAVAITALMLTLVAVPFVINDAEPEPICEDELGGWLDDTITVAKLMVSAPFLVGYAVSETVLEWIWGTELDNTAGLPEEIKKFAREQEMISVQEKVGLVSRLGSSLIDNDRQVLALSRMHMNRAVEITAGMMWYEGNVFKPDAILEFSGVTSLLGMANHNTQQAMDWAYDQSANRVSAWAAADNWATGLTIKFVWNGGGTANAASNINLDFTTIMYAGAGNANSGNNLFYLDTTSMKSNPTSHTNNSVYNFGVGGTFTYADTGAQFPIAANTATDVSSWPTGWYWASPGTYAGPFLSSTTVGRVASTEGGVVIDVDGHTGYITVDGAGTLHINYGGSTYESEYLDYSISSDGTTKTTTNVLKENDIISNMIRSYHDYYNEILSVQFEAANAALTMWTISAQAHESNILLSPSSVIPQLENVNIDAIQAYAIYISALEQIASYWKNNGEVLKAADMRISEQSLELYCFGSIYNPDGTVLAKNVIFTPYVYVRNMTISKLGYNTFTQAGAVMVWDTEASTASGWDGTSTNNTGLIVVGEGAYFESPEIYYQHKLVPNTITLEVRTIRATDIFSNWTPILLDTPKMLNATTLIMIIFVELGVIIALLGWMFKSPLVIIIGVVVIVLGVFMAPLMSRLFLNLFGV